MKSEGVTITVLAENTAQGMALLGEHGLSLWIETPETCVLFDTGQGLVLPHNTDTLGVALDCADAIVLSHGHYDHTGGLLQAMGQNPHVRLFLHPNGIEDDQAMWIETPTGVVVLLGCAHSGVINTVDYIQDLAGRKLIRAVVGGMHLGSASDERVARTIASLNQLNIEGLWPCHCTGVAATAWLVTAFGARCRPCGAGTRIEF